MIFPGHTSHILQAFDVSIAAPLKTAYKKRILKYDIVFDKAGDKRKELKTTLMEIRIMMIQCLLDALSESATLSNIQSGFRASGICPLNLNMPLSSKFAMNDLLRTQYPELYSRVKGDNLINNRNLNGNLENLGFVYHAEFHFPLTEQELKINEEIAKEKIQSLFLSQNNGVILLSPVPDVVDTTNGVMKLISFNQ